MTTKSDISNSLIMGLLAGPIASGLSAKDILVQAQVPTSILTNPDQALNLQQFGSVIQTIFQVMDDESSGFLVQPIKVGSFAMMNHAVITCPNLRRALLRGSHFMSLISSEVHFSIREQGEEATLKVAVDNSKNLQADVFITTILIIWTRWSCWLIDRPLLLERANFTCDPPPYAEDLKQVFPCRHYYNQPHNSVVFNQRFLDMPLKQDAQSLVDFLASAPECLLTEYKTDNSVTAEVRLLLTQDDELEGLSLEMVAAQLNTSSQTLRRRLKEEGNSFQQIKDSLRRDTAIYHLSKQITPINEIAALVGFSEPSAFNRAFKRWTGMAPGAYREQK